MIEKACNLWIEPAEYRCVLTSAAVANGEAQFDSRSAVEAAGRFAGLATDLGRLLSARGNHVHLIRPGLCSFPIKQFQWSLPTLAVIERSAQELVAIVGTAKTLLPRPVTDQDNPNWETVAKALSFLPDNVVVVS